MFYLRSVSSTSFLRITTRETIFIGQISNLPHFYDCQKKRLLFFCKHSVLILLFAMQQRNQQFEQVLEIEKRRIHLLSQMSLSQTKAIFNCYPILAQLLAWTCYCLVYSHDNLWQQVSCREAVRTRRYLNSPTSRDPLSNLLFLSNSPNNIGS